MKNYGPKDFIRSETNKKLVISLCPKINENQI